MAEAIDVGTISARGQVAIPAEIREKMHLKEGEKVLFMLEGDSLLMKRVSSLSWEEITKPLREAAKKIKEEDVVELVHKVRKEKKQ
jgi:AbrB family looped-hinge helix DNA binding protein